MHAVNGRSGRMARGWRSTMTTALMLCLMVCSMPAHETVLPLVSSYVHTPAFAEAAPQSGGMTIARVDPTEVYRVKATCFPDEALTRVPADTLHQWRSLYYVPAHERFCLIRDTVRSWVKVVFTVQLSGVAPGRSVTHVVKQSEYCRIDTAYTLQFSTRAVIQNKLVVVIVQDTEGRMDLYYYFLKDFFRYER